MATAPNGNLYAANAQSNTITAYAPGATGNAAPVVTLGGGTTGITGADGIAIDTNGRLYVANCGTCFLASGTPSILVFASGVSGNVAPIQTIAGSNTGFTDITDVQLDHSGNILASDYGTNTVFIYPTSATGNVAASATISGSNTLIASPECAVSDAAGTIYVCNSTNNTITEYAAGSSGNVAPIRTIGGANTLLDNPTQISFDGSGNIYVANPGTSNAITVYAPNASGNVAPIRYIAGSNTTLAGPIGITLGPFSATTFGHVRRF
jgi:sugar lactone lactonase YvrE